MAGVSEGGSNGRNEAKVSSAGLGEALVFTPLATID